MAEEKYTWDDIIINPTSQEAKNAVGKEVYYGDSPTETLDNAIENRNAVILDSIELKENMPFKVDLGFEGFFLFSCIIVKKEKPYSKRAKKWIEENNLKVGDYVKILRKTEPFEKRWGGFWVDQMSDYIGKALKVLAINQLNGLISLECDYIGYNFPYFVLEKAEPPKPKYVPFESEEEFIKAFDDHTHSDKDSEIKSILYMFGMWLKWKGEYVAVTHINDNGINENTNMEADWQDLCDNYTFLDGSSCGKLVEESNG